MRAIQAARANYLEGQDAIRRELIHKKFEKESGRIIEELIWGVPAGCKLILLTTCICSMSSSQCKHPFWRTSGWRASSCRWTLDPPLWRMVSWSTARRQHG